MLHSLLLYPLDPVFHLLSALFDFYSVTSESRDVLVWATTYYMWWWWGWPLKKSLTPFCSLALLTFDRWIHANNGLLLTKWQFNSQLALEFKRELIYRWRCHFCCNAAVFWNGLWKSICKSKNVFSQLCSRETVKWRNGEATLGWETCTQINLRVTTTDNPERAPKCLNTG